MVSAARRFGRRGRAVRRPERGRGGGGAGGGAARGPRGRQSAGPAHPAQGGPDAAGLPAPPRRGEETSSRLNSLGRVAGTIYALANQKGGVGKTTTAINLAACLAEAGERSLVVDLDPQANATSGLGERANGTSSYDLLDGAPLAELAKPTRFQNLHLVPAKPDLAGAAVELSRRPDGERYLAEGLAQAGESYRFVFVDCPPSL